ncbi:ATP-binding cassette sub-family C member 3-like isoform X2 [Amblyomma americanum]
MADTLSCVKLIKLYAWEDAAAKAVSGLREREGSFIFFANLLDGFVDSLQASSCSLMMIVLLGTYAIANNSVMMKPAYCFSSLYILTIIDAVFLSMATALRSRSIVSQCLRRMLKTLTAEEGDPQMREAMDGKKGCVTLDKCSFIWSDQDKGEKRRSGTEEPVLRDVTLHVPPGAFVGVVGRVGGGKTALLAAILGELRCLRGTVCVGGTVAYVAQTASIFNMSIRDNVLFGKPMRPFWYQKVLEACDLFRDMERLPAGDLTEVGERGETLSGGQKQRVSLARAAYSDSDVYLIDDTLSALDVHVAAKVFARVIGPDGILKEKTRFVVCNQDVFLGHVDKLLVVTNQSVVRFESLHELIADPRCPKTLLSGSGPQSSSKDHLDQMCYALLDDKTGAMGKLTTEETRDADLGTLSLLRSLVAMCGVSLPLALLSIVARAVTVAILLFCIKMWLDSSVSRATGDSGANSSWITLLTILALCDLFFSSLGGFLLALSCRRLSARLHEDMLRRVLLCPVSFFEASPRGRLLNRFSGDLDLVDCQLYITVKEVLQALTVVVARLAVVGTQVPAACVLGLLATGVYITAVVAAVRTSNVFRSLENACMSRVLQHVAETRDSMSSVRCYGAMSLFCRRFYRLIDGAMRYSWAMIACVRFTRVTGSLAGLSAVFAAVLALSISSSPHTITEDGLVLSTAISIPTMLSAMNAALFFAFISAVAFERAVEYTKLQPEDACDEDEAALKSKEKQFVQALHETGSQKAWPSGGNIVFENFTASYNSGLLSPVLKNVSFVITPREKVGIVGRTGAGKSSLILALLGVLAPSAGRIVIDGVDVALVRKRRLRSAITVIPQAYLP